MYLFSLYGDNEEKKEGMTSSEDSSAFNQTLS
jgi:hypothetical protein